MWGVWGRAVKAAPEHSPGGWGRGGGRDGHTPGERERCGACGAGQGRAVKSAPEHFPGGLGGGERQGRAHSWGA